MSRPSDLVQASLRTAPVAVVDVETTGLSPWGDRVVEVAVLTADGRRERLGWTSLVHPGRAVPVDVQDIHGITDAMVESAPRFRDVAPRLVALLEGRVVVAHNASFDLRFLVAELARSGQALRHGPVLDTLAVARRWYEFAGNSLPVVADALGCRAPRHRALDDVRATFDVFRAFVADFPRGARVADWIEAQGGEIVAPTLETALPTRHPLTRALRSGGPLRVRYTDTFGAVTERTIEPLAVAGRHLEAFCHLRGETRTFRVDRIEVRAGR